MSGLLKGKRVVITGGAGLLGRTFCTAIAEHGGQAVVADRDLDAAQRAVDSIVQQYPGGAVAATLDITDKDSVDAMIDDVHARCGRIDAIVNNAYPRNSRYGRRMEEVEYADFCDNLGMHLGGTSL